MVKMQSVSRQCFTAIILTLFYHQEIFGLHEQCNSLSHQNDSSILTKLISSSGQMFQDPSELLKFVQKDQTDQKYHCVLCNKFSHKTSYCARNHVEAHHFPNMFVYLCDKCELTFSTKSSITTQIARKHKKQ